ncbi:hypothetical protein DS834_07980 [Lactobacillus bombicola]|uniref:Transposase DDE domain-containing protein n=1 Tax=Lactobacillus bombicola TaxID=1505723 RepID=A0ABX9LSU5_9LACO|nr:hypothetical protein DS834_07980 [Lactobacillus bombicola]
MYGQRKIDVEPVFGHLKNVFGLRWVHLRGQIKVDDHEFEKILVKEQFYINFGGQEEIRSRQNTFLI